MSKKVIVLHLGSLVDVKYQRSIDAFAKLGISKVSMLWHSLPLPKWLQGGYLLHSIDRLRIGDITSGEFRKEVKALFSSTISRQQFDQAWNAQCVVTAKTKAAFKQIESFEKAGHTVYVISGTNPLHRSHIEQQYGKPIPGNHVFSHEKGLLGKELIEDFVQNTLRIEHADLEDEDILWLAKKAKDPHPSLGKWGWLVSPVEKLFFHKSEQEYASLAQLESDTGLFTLIKQSHTDEPLLQPVMNKLHTSRQEENEVFGSRAILHQKPQYGRDKSAESRSPSKATKPGNPQKTSTSKMKQKLVL